jgi:hypothetical protein
MSDSFKWIYEKSKSRGDNNFRIEEKESTACITSFNCNGAKNIYKIKAHCKEHKPVAMGIQEIRSKNNKRLLRLSVPGYVTVSGSLDTAILVREDIRISQKGTIEGLEDLPHEFVQLETNDGKIRIVNIYCRDACLKYSHLSTLENFGSKTFFVGDFNAKHRQFLPHTQTTDYNKNGEVLYKYLQGDHCFEQESKLHCHNVHSPNVYTRAVEDKWVQLDLIFSHPDLIDKVDKFVYNDELMSDHKGVSVYCPRLFKPKERYLYFDEVYDWDSYNPLVFQLTSKATIEAVTNVPSWHKLSIDEKANRIQRTLEACLFNAVDKKKRSTRKKTLPGPLVDLIKTRREKRILFNKINSETNKRAELAALEDRNYTISFDWTDDKLEKNMPQAENLRVDLVSLTKEINAGFADLKKANWSEALDNLSKIDSKKAQKEFWATITRLTGKGRKNEPPSFLKYKGVTSMGHEDVANSFGDYFEDTYQPQVDDSFDQNLITQTNELAGRIRQIWDKPELLNNKVKIKLETKDPVLKGDFRKTVINKPIPPTPTKHMKKNHTQIIDRNLYKNKKGPLPNLPPLNLEIGNNLVDIHNTDRLKAIKKRTLEPFDLADFLKVISKTKKKAPGKDGLFINQIKDLNVSVLGIILDIYNEIWKSGKFPDIWKAAVVIPLLKKGKVAGDPTSYRPISLLPIMGKLLESLIHPRMNDYFMDRKLIPDFQTGFRKGKSTSVNLRRLYNNTYFQSTIGINKRPTASVFFDAKKAFDTVCYDGLIVKLARDGVPAQILRLIGNWITDRTLMVRIGKELSRVIRLRSGVPQGSVISPLIWNYWLGDCPMTLSPHAYTALYADDIALWVSHPQVTKLIRILNSEIGRLVAWTRRKRLVLTPEKTYAIATHTLKGKREKIKKHQIYMDEERDVRIEWQSQAVLLGILFHETGSFAPHIMNKVRLANARVRALWRFNEVIPGKTLYNVYKAAIEPILTYGTEVFYESINDILAKKLLSVEFNALRCCYRLRKETSKADMFNLLEGSSIMERINKRRENFLQKNINEQLIMYNETLPFSQGRRHRTHKLYIPPRAPRDWRRILYVHKPRVFLSDVGAENINNWTTHHEFTMDKTQEIIGKHTNPLRQKLWRENRKQDVVGVSKRGIPSYETLDAMLEPDLNPQQTSFAEISMEITIPRFNISIPTQWEVFQESRIRHQDNPDASL